MKTDLKIALGAFAAYCVYIFHKAKKAKGTSGVSGLSEGEFEELVRYVSDHVDHEWDRIGMKYIEERSPIPYQLEGQINDYAEEWCNDNDIDPDEYWDEYNAEDVFLHPKYDYDS